MLSQIQLGDIAVDVIRKDIKNVHLSIHPPTGRVRIAAPERMSLDIVRLFAISKLGWIRRHQRKVRAQERETRRDFVDRESHYVWGKRYLLNIVDGRIAGVELTRNQLILRAPDGASAEKREAILYRWYRSQLRESVPSFLEKWQRLMSVQVNDFYVQRMKTKWGSCNSDRGTIRLNAELAKKPPQCLEYIVVHEMVHLLEHTHNQRFIALMDRYMPKWQSYRDELNRLPVRHDDWEY